MEGGQRPKGKRPGKQIYLLAIDEARELPYSVLRRRRRRRVVEFAYSDPLPNNPNNHLNPNRDLVDPA